MRQVPFGKPIIGEAEKLAVQEVLSGSILVHGPKAEEFEQVFAKWTGAQNCVSVASCTAGMHLFYFSHKIGPGDEVIVPAQTHVATAHAVELTGAKAVFADAEINTGNIDISQIESGINEHTKAITIVHYLGVPVDMNAVNAIAKRHNLLVLEDCALAVGTKQDGIHAGLHGDAGAFSFYPVKHMTTAEGGVVLTKHDDLAAKLRREKAFGVDRTPGERKIPGVYDVNMLGFNYRMNEIEAAIGIAQVERLDGFLEARKHNYETLYNQLSEIDELQLFKPPKEGYQSSYYCLSAMLVSGLAEKRFEVVSWLNQKGIGTSIYYPKAVPAMKYYKDKYGYKEDNYPVASRISNTSIALPVGPHLNEEDMEYIASTIKEAIVKVKN